MLKVGMSSCAFPLTEENFKGLKEAGISDIEISLAYDKYEGLDIAAVKKLADQNGVNIWSYHLPFSGPWTCDIASHEASVRSKTVGYWSDLIRKAADVGIDKFVVHPSSEPKPEDSERETFINYSKENLDILAEFAAKQGAVIAVEDLPRTCLGRTADEIADLISVNDKLRVCFDTNHLLIDDNLSFAEKLGSKIVTIHASDYFFVDECHKAGIGVIVDWVPAHFPKDAHGLAEFDGTCLYEYPDPRKGEHPDWGTKIFNYGKTEVKNYLIANVFYWLREFHIDGIRVDAVASMLYLDYGRKDGNWEPNIYGGRENLEAVEFIKHVNSIMHIRNEGVIMVAEESTAWPQVTGDLNDGGLGFDFKWNMGWMNDFLGYIQEDPYFRQYHHNELTFSMIYAYTEKFMLVFSHDEVVHGKGSMLGKMPGNYDDKFHNLKAAYAYMMTHPGKKLLFMGQDIGEFDEWNQGRSVQWDLLNFEKHQGVFKMMSKLNEIYKTYPAMHKLDGSWQGFEWINCMYASASMLSFLKKTDKEEETLLVVINFANAAQDFKVGVPFSGTFTEIFNSDDVEFAGRGDVNKDVKVAAKEESDGREYSVWVHMAPLSGAIFAYKPERK